MVRVGANSLQLLFRHLPLLSWATGGPPGNYVGIWAVAKQANSPGPIYNETRQVRVRDAT